MIVTAVRQKAKDSSVRLLSLCCDHREKRSDVIPQASIAKNEGEATHHTVCLYDKRSARQHSKRGMEASRFWGIRETLC